MLCIGAGPASLAAAIVCARGNLQVTIVAPWGRNVSVGHAPSETLHPGIEAPLRFLDATQAMDAATRATYHGIWRGDAFTPLGRDEHGVWIGRHIDRVEFDARMLSIAERTGAKVVVGRVDDILMECDRATGVVTSAGTIATAVVIDGSGRSAIVARRLGMQEVATSPPLIAWSALLDDVTSRDREPSFTEFDDGWEWLAPEARGRATWTRLVVAGRSRVARPAIPAGRLASKLVGKSVQWRSFRSVVMDGLVLVGDAAGLIDPGTGQGVFRGILSGIRAGHAIIAAFVRPDTASFALAGYDDWFASEYAKQATLLRQSYRFLQPLNGATRAWRTDRAWITE